MAVEPLRSVRTVAFWSNDLPGRLAVGAGLAVALGLPFVLVGGDLRLMTTVWMFAALAQCWNFVGGYVGYAAFGNVVFFGLGGYATAAVMLAGGPFGVGLLAGAVGCTLFAAVVGWLVLRLRGHYFAIATLGVAEATRELVLNFDPLGAASGLSLPIARDSRLFYYLLLALVVALAALTWWLTRSRLGYAFVAIRENEDAAAALGIDTYRYKIVAFALSAGFTGIVGGIYAYWSTFIDPSTVFNSAYSVEMIAVCLIGGAGTILGPVIGSILFELLAGQIWAHFISWHATILGLVIIALVLFLPQGLASLRPGRWLGYRVVRHRG
ncbi:MAG TPA: branched-chain amino acid ABC transporter permease [Chloroflexota bacterium]|jgi:branched-chain amino acid transport system permease protein